MQKLPAGKFHGVPPEMIKSPFEKAGCVVQIDMIPGAANANPGIAMWTQATRKNYSRKTVRYQSDVTDEEWRVIEPHLPPARTTGRPRAWPLREIVNGIFYVMRSGCAWRQLPTDLPPWGTVYRWFVAWRDACLFEKINHALVMADRGRVGRQASLSLSETYALKYWWCSPPRTGIASGRPTVWAARGTGASLSSDRCVRASL
jgi:transposase